MKRDGSAMNALIALLFGLGILLLLVGPLTDLYAIGIGFVALVGCWVVAITLTVFCFGGKGETRSDRYA